MKLIRFGAAGHELPGVELPDGTRVDVSSTVTDFDESFFAGDGLATLQQWIASRASTAKAVPHGDVAGYVLHNDYSERSFQLERGGQWVKGKERGRVRAIRAMARHCRRDFTPAESCDVALGQWRARPGNMESQ